ncbi:type I-E CRISPR-associated protein Cas6/Cse3/CasE [Streptomyces sp. NPDC004267]|uniref:type I-E CRISPR-associated protein Cas6/Cse3/CasE n=1 Tax=Streptomyces sp. NPDC004267 TaxID=3364694 RepID=UPI0036A6BB45
MFLTRFRMNTARPGTRRLLSSPQALHAAVMSSFPNLLPSDQASGDGPRVLWRLDHNAKAEVLLYLVSPEQPDLTHLVEQSGWPTTASPGAPGWQTRPYAPLLDRLAKGDRWAFRLTANPVHHIRRTGDEPRKRTAHLTPTHQLQWLLDFGRQERAGFRVLEKREDKRLLPGGTTYNKHPHHGDRYEVHVRDQRALAFGKRADGGGRGGQVSLVTVTFDGRLEITDPERMRLTLTAGLGKAKAYGCGLMTLAPLTSRPVR